MKPKENIQISNNKTDNSSVNAIRSYCSSDNNSEIVSNTMATTTQSNTTSKTIIPLTKTAVNTNIRNNISESLTSQVFSTDENSELIEIPQNVMEALNLLINNKFSTREFKYDILPVSGRGENSYGSVLQIKFFLNNSEQEKNNKANNDNDSKNDNCSNVSNKDVNNKDNNKNDKLFHCIVKISPKNEARRLTMKVVEYYQRENYFYKNILIEYMKLQKNLDNEYNNTTQQIDYNDDQKLISTANSMKIAPILYASALEAPNEFLLLEDLHQSGYSRFNRKVAVTYNHVVLAIKELAKYHAMSFVLRIKNPEKFYQIIEDIKTDNLFSEDLAQISVEFGKKYMKAAIKMLETENQLHSKNLKNREKIIKSISKLYLNFKDICIKLVNGNIIEPHAAICHGDFWNNNILYKYDDNNIPISAKVIDFQMVRYSSPILDLVHYLFTCTGKQLRDKHFDNFKDNYYNQLASTLRNFDLDPNEIFPRLIFENQLQQYGIYGFCMACYAIPFFISDSSDLPNLDEASEAMRELSESSSDDSEYDEDKNLKTTALLEEYEMLNERTTPIFKERMVGVLIDLAKYNMLDSVFLKS